jgi:hypothetical protein
MATYLEAHAVRESKDDDDLLFFKSLMPLLKSMPQLKKEELKMEFHGMVLRAAFQHPVTQHNMPVPHEQYQLGQPYPQSQPGQAYPQSPLGQQYQTL